MKMLDYTIALWVETRISRLRNTQRTADSGPDEGGELGVSILCMNRWNPKQCNPGEEKCSDTRFCSERPQQSHLWPLSCPVNHGEKVGKAMTRRKRSHEIQIHVGKTYGWLEKRHEHESVSCSTGNGDRYEPEDPGLWPIQATGNKLREV